jgi:hypothetical protein
MLQGLLPVLVARMGRLPVEEPAEEVRLAAQELIQVVVNKAQARCVASIVGATRHARCARDILATQQTTCWMRFLAFL